METFTAEIVVTDRDQRYEPEMAQLASRWFKAPVRCISVDVTLGQDRGGPSYLARGTYVKDSERSRSKAESLTRWLGLVRGPA